MDSRQSPTFRGPAQSRFKNNLKLSAADPERTGRYEKLPQSLHPFWDFDPEQLKALLENAGSQLT
jgi:hypothetical protein